MTRQAQADASRVLPSPRRPVREHSCAGCGAALARIGLVGAGPQAPGGLDPMYRLAVVVCPGCQTAVVRRRHPMERFQRGWWIAVRSVMALVIRGGLLVGVSAAAVAVLSNTSANFPTQFQTIYDSLAGDYDQMGGFGLTSRLRSEAVTGTLLIGLGFGFLWASLTGHIRRWWLVVGGAGLALLPCIIIFSASDSSRVGLSIVPVLSELRLRTTFFAWGWLMIMAIVAGSIGRILAISARWSAAHWERARWNRRRHRLRTLGAST